MSKKLINIIIPNYNGLEHLKTCYSSIKKQSFKDYKIVLVDNNSSDGSVKYTKKAFRKSVILELDRNYGFAKAVNEGINFSLAASECRYILLLNNDIELEKNFLKTGINTFKKTPDVSMIAVKMLNYFDRTIIDDCGDFIKGRGGSPSARGHGEKDEGQFDKEEFIFGACAGAAFYKKEIFENAGIFDEDFFAYYEDIDFSFRAHLLGYRCFYQPKAVCYHKRGGTSSVATQGFQAEMCERNLVLMRIKNYPLATYILYQPLFFAARLKRYYLFIKNNSFKIFIKAVKGYLRGFVLLPFQISKRLKIQRERKVSVSYIKSFFT